MSSIYRKGRDGYFYYQTYVVNPTTGNKDKRIYHSLGTKNRSLAEKKQIEYDMKYERLQIKNEKPHKRTRSLTNMKIGSVVLVTMLLTLTISNLYHSKLQGEKKIKTTMAEKENTSEDFADTISISIQNQSFFKQEKNNLSDLQSKEPPIDSYLNEKIVIPDYKIIRIERLSNSFRQGKVHVAVNESTSNESQRALCQTLTKSLTEFSNIVICLYADNPIGIELANGKKEITSTEQKKQYWLAMYTFNPVEGEYFDDYPSGYLGLN